MSQGGGPEGDRELAQDVDEVVVRRVLDGEHHLPTNKAEKAAIAAAWVASGRSLADLGRLTGWRAERYGTNPTADSQRRKEAS